jgi:hypothetical protein
MTTQSMGDAERSSGHKLLRGSDKKKTRSFCRYNHFFQMANSTTDEPNGFVVKIDHQKRTFDSNTGFKAGLILNHQKRN